MKTYSNNKGILEQAFGLFSNLTLKMPAIAELLTEKYELLGFVERLFSRVSREFQKG